MQIGIDLGATKIEYVLVDNNNKVLKYYDSFDVTAKEIKEDLEQLLAY